MIFLYAALGILAVLATMAIILAIVVAIRPGDFRIERSTTISAQAQTVFDRVNDFHHWNDWSPWHKLDPNMKQTYDGPASGVGAVYSWVGDKKVGEGRMTILESVPARAIKIKLEFIKPWTATNTSEFTFSQQGDATAVTWSMTGVNGFMGRAFSMIMNMDKLIGADFEKGLAQLKALAETR